MSEPAVAIGRQEQNATCHPITSHRTNLPPDVIIGECWARDGLQSETVMVSTDEKLEVIELLLAAGFRRIEVTSFANPKQVDSCSLSARCSGCFS